MGGSDDCGSDTVAAQLWAQPVSRTARFRSVSEKQCCIMHRGAAWNHSQSLACFTRATAAADQGRLAQQAGCNGSAHKEAKPYLCKMPV
jgi:hypothetical protein